ncbi:MAG: hypothetical protein ACMUJM_09195 [bacterium]
MRKYYCVIILIMLFPVTVCAKSKTHDMAIEPKWGWYFPDHRTWWQEGSAQRRYSFFGGLEAKYEFLNSTEVSLGVNYLRESWERTNEDDPNAITTLYNYIYMLPVDISLNYKLRYADKQFLVPYGGIGFDYIYCKERQEPTVRFHRYGYHLTLGGQLMLNYFIPDEESDLDLDEKFGINAAYLFFEGRYTNVDNFGNLDGHDISGYFYSMGILLEF